MPGPAPPVVHGLQIDQSLDFQRRFHRVQRIAWRLLALLPVAAVLGLFGGGLLSERTVRTDGATVVYDRFARQAVDTQVEVTATRARGSTAVAVSRGLLDGYDLSEVRPQPQRVASDAGQVVYAFAAQPGTTIAFTLQPKRLGSSSGTVTVRGARPVRLHQLVYP